MTTQYHIEPETTYAANSPGCNQLAQTAWTKWSGMGALVGSIAFFVLFTALGLLRPDYSPIRQAISDLGVGPLDWILNTGLIVTGALLVVFAFACTQDAMRPVVNPGLRWMLGLLLESPGLGLAIAGIFPETQPTHWVVGAPLLFVGSVLGFLITGWQLRRVRGWRGFSIYSFVAGGLALAFVVLQNLAFAAQYGAMPGSPLAELQVGGLAERLVFLNFLTWYSVAGWRLATYRINYRLA